MRSTPLVHVDRRQSLGSAVLVRALQGVRIAALLAPHPNGHLGVAVGLIAAEVAG
jgi:hypothetical protein